MQLRFAELEATGLAERDDATPATSSCARGRAHDDRIGADGAADATSFSAHARLHHCCPTDQWGKFLCAKNENLKKAPQLVARADGTLVENERHKQARQPSEEPAVPEDKKHGVKPVPADDPRLADLPSGQRYFESDGHLFKLYDPTAGPRRYRKGQAWVGGLLMGIADVFTGAPLAFKAIPADQNESSHYADLLDRALTATDGAIVRMAGDRGYSFRKIFEHNSTRGIASIIPWRRISHTEKERSAEDRDDYDRHGVPRCRHCGGPCDVTAAALGFHIKADGRPVIRYQCTAALTPDCGPIQEISCRAEWRMLIPLSRHHDSYHAMAVAGKALERAWSAWRERYGLAGKQPETRSRRRYCIPCQELRAQTARFIEWFRILLRHGFLASARHSAPDVFSFDGGRRLRSTLRARDRHGLNRPYGTHAEAAGLAPNAQPPPAGESPPNTGEDDYPF